MILSEKPVPEPLPLSATRAFTTLSPFSSQSRSLSLLASAKSAGKQSRDDVCSEFPKVARGPHHPSPSTSSPIMASATESAIERRGVSGAGAVRWMLQ